MPFSFAQQRRILHFSELARTVFLEKTLMRFAIVLGTAALLIGCHHTEYQPVPIDNIEPAPAQKKYAGDTTADLPPVADTPDTGAVALPVKVAAPDKPPAVAVNVPSETRTPVKKVSPVEKSPDDVTAAEEPRTPPPATDPLDKIDFTEEIVDEFVAMVNNQAILASRIVRDREKERRRLAAQGLTPTQIAGRLQDFLTRRLIDIVDEILVLDEAQKILPDKVKEEIEKDIRLEFAKTVDSYGGRKKFEDYLKEQELEEEEVKKQIRLRHYYRKIVRMKFSSYIWMVSPEEIEDYYKKHPDQFLIDRKYRFRRILIDSDDYASVEDAVAEAEQAIRKIKQGVGIDLVVRDYSVDPRRQSGGVWEFQGKITWIGELAVVAEKMQRGDVSHVIKVKKPDRDNSYLLNVIYLERIFPGRMRPLSEVQEEIRAIIESAKMEERWREWINDLRREKAYIKSKYLGERQRPAGAASPSDAE